MPRQFPSLFCFLRRDANRAVLVLLSFTGSQLTVITSRAAGFALPVLENWQQAFWRGGALSSPGIARRAGRLHLRHRAHHVAPAASASVPVSVSEDPATVASSKGVSTKESPRGAAVAAAIHTYRGWRRTHKFIFIYTVTKQLISQLVNKLMIQLSNFLI